MRDIPIPAALELHMRMSDDQRIEHLKTILANDPSMSCPFNAKFFRYVWEGNYLCRGNPVFVHPDMGYEDIEAALHAIQTMSGIGFMEEAERQALAALPDMVTIWRAGNSTGFSWTTSRKVADKFAHPKFAYNRGIMRLITKRQIPRDMIAAYLSGSDQYTGDEYEAIPRPEWLREMAWQEFLTRGD